MNQGVPIIMSLKYLMLLVFFASCGSAKVKPLADLPMKTDPVKEFAPGELILATQLLTKIFDKEMGPLSCIPDTDEASLLLRTIRPRMEVVQDDMEAMLDDSKEVSIMIQNCDKNCTCPEVDDLIREHLVVLPKAQRKMLSLKRNDKELNRCLNYAQSTFCQSELYKQLEREKSDFSFEEVVE
jgi:hypothetical protein